eukprot:c22688_g1_i1 orf=229-1320(-)
MAGWIKTRIKLQEIMGLMKDQVALGHAMVKQGQLSQINLVVLRATSQKEHITEEETIKSVLEVGGGSRMRVSHCIRLIMDRLNKTHSWTVALKCLLLIHRCLHEGGFMFQDQLSSHPSCGGRNYLNLSKFKDTSSPFTWAVSAWIRWYARFIEQWIQTSRNVGAFLDSKEEDKSLHAEKLMSLASSQLVKDIISLDDFVREVSGWLAEDFVMDHALVKEGLRLAIVTTVKVYTELKLRFREVTERISTFARKEALELLHVCERLSKDTMMLTHLFETGEDLHGQHVSGQVVDTDYEMMKLKEALRLASLHNVSTSPEQACNNDGFSQPWKSMRWEKSTLLSLGSGDARRGKSLSDFNFYETLL